MANSHKISMDNSVKNIKYLDQVVNSSERRENRSVQRYNMKEVNSNLNSCFDNWTSKPESVQNNEINMKIDVNSQKDRLLQK